MQRLAWACKNLYRAGQKLTVVKTGEQIHPLTLHPTMYDYPTIKRPIEKTFSLPGIFNDPVSMTLSKHIFHRILESQQIYEE